ncbi:hypothetical protein AVEN_22836-1 [Araneus ventricosus]|uniref:Uncharacterized protein n=1 Tax=Araneus ventricosus TaxID=182803 RepID=A0A4Y2L8Q1_ARAVE|nr:hypothetical protein AVEN_22836-1 [Araneus ventricosus]
MSLMSENCRLCDITSLPVNEIYVVCSSKVNSRNNESTNTITIWEISLALIIRRASRVLIWHLSSVNIDKSMFSGATKLVGSMPGKSHSILLKATRGNFSHAFRFRPMSPVKDEGPEDLRSNRCRNGNSLK